MPFGRKPRGLADCRRQCSLNPYALPTVIVLMPEGGFPSSRPHSAGHANHIDGGFGATVARETVCSRTLSDGAAGLCKRASKNESGQRVRDAVTRSARFLAPPESQCGATDVRMRRDGPPRMEGRSTWSGRERSSHSRFPPVPRVGLVTFHFFFRIFPTYDAALYLVRDAVFRLSRSAVPPRF